MTKVFNLTEHTQKRKKLRQSMPPAEVLLWDRLKGRQLSDLKFRRQYGVGPYVIDFYCPAIKLAIEIDGESHENELAQQYDMSRQALVETYNICFLRFSNEQVYSALPVVLETIALKATEITAHSTNLPRPLLAKEGSTKATL